VERCTILMINENEAFWRKLREIYSEKDKSNVEFEKEEPVLRKILIKIEEEPRFNLKNKGHQYEFMDPIDRGGAGVIVKVKDIILGRERALKFPRPLPDDRIVESVKTEIRYLKEIQHNNIIRIYGAGEIDVDNGEKFPYYIMEFIEDASSLTKSLNKKINNAKEISDLNHIISWIADVFTDVSNAIQLLHQENVIHFDIKPDNILIDRNNCPCISDLGFAKKKTNDNNKVVVGFTLYYAHPKLKEGYEHKSSENRVRKPISPAEFDYKWDIYALGKTLLETLNNTAKRFPDSIFYNYNFVYLHLMACRMLDGYNQNSHPIDVGEDKNLEETWMELGAIELNDVKYNSISEICNDLKKLNHLEFSVTDIPELNYYNPKKVQISKGFSAPFTPRVKNLIEHPVFYRLHYTPQLGLINTIFPTANHNRLEHSLGAFDNTIRYVRSLIYDPYNPIFRQLMNPEDLKDILLASLIHDLGHYPLAHEIEEYFGKDFSHQQLTLKFLHNPTQDKNNHTVKDIIENPDWGWGIKLEQIENFLVDSKPQRTLTESNNIKINLLKTIIDGPIDADKLDYLVRDSENSNLPYANMMDIDRFLNNLTVVILGNESTREKKSLTIGSYDKSQSAAETFAFTRYLLYQSLYWHHTARGIRTMIRESIVPIFSTKLSSTSKNRKKTKYDDFYQDFINLLGINGQPNNINTMDILNLIEKHTDESGKRLIQMIKNRNYYKRILTIHSYKSQDEGKTSLLNEFRDICRDPNFQQSLQEKIKLELDQYATKSYPKTSLLSDEKISKTLSILSNPQMILCDAPLISTGSESNLHFIPEPQRLQKNYFDRAETGQRVSEVWNKVYFNLMDIVSKGRVYCHPDIRDQLMASLGPKGIETCVIDVMMKK
jgi:HD superfamily phosphohydrolase/tRNA A-37 threonylcarbamoyl transferase component Bud32